MQRLLAVLLVLIGLIGLALGRLGETTWAPATETTATVDLADPGAAVLIDPGVLYVGGEQGEVVIEGASDVSVITAANGDIEAYLEDAKYTRITGASDWTTLSTQEVNPDGAAEIPNPTDSDLWRTVDTAPSPYTLDVHEFWSEENGEDEQVYRSLLIVTDGTEPGADKVSITWPVEDENEWVPFAYAGGAAIAVIGLVLLVVSLGGSRRRDEDEELEEAHDAPADGADGVASGAIAGSEPGERDTAEGAGAVGAAAGAGAGAGAVGAAAVAAGDQDDSDDFAAEDADAAHDGADADADADADAGAADADAAGPADPEHGEGDPSPSDGTGDEQDGDSASETAADSSASSVYSVGSTSVYDPLAPRSGSVREESVWSFGPAGSAASADGAGAADAPADAPAGKTGAADASDAADAPAEGTGATDGPGASGATGSSAAGTGGPPIDSTQEITLDETGEVRDEDGDRSLGEHEERR